MGCIWCVGNGCMNGYGEGMDDCVMNMNGMMIYVMIPSWQRKFSFIGLSHVWSRLELEPKPVCYFWRSIRVAYGP